MCTIIDVGRVMRVLLRTHNWHAVTHGSQTCDEYARPASTTRETNRALGAIAEAQSSQACIYYSTAPWSLTILKGQGARSKRHHSTASRSLRMSSSIWIRYRHCLSIVPDAIDTYHDFSPSFCIQ